MSRPPVGITGVGRCLPERVVTSSEVEQMVTDRSESFRMPSGMIRLVSGVEQRRYATDDTASSDLAAAAGSSALDMAVVDPESIDLVIFASASHDVSEPATANMVQTKTGCTRAAVFDLKNACNSFLNAVDVALAMVETGRAGTVLVTAGEVLSPTIRWDIEHEDLRTRFAALTLGDAGAACVIARTDNGRIHPGHFVSDGAHWDLSTVMGGGTLMRHDHSRHHFECDSARLADVASVMLPRVVAEALDRLGWSYDDIDFVIPHQVSKSIIDLITEVVGFPRERCAVTLDRFGNTAAASIPLALATAHDEARIARGNRILLVGGAAGFSAGVLGIEWGLDPVLRAA